MKTSIQIILAALIIMIIPSQVNAQAFGDGVYSLNTVLEELFNEMLPLCSRLIDVGRAIAGFAALWYIAMRVWKHIARAEGIDFFPLLRPFAIGMAIVLYPHVIGLMNGVLKPLEVGTREMSKDSHKAIELYILNKEKEIMAPQAGGIYPEGSDAGTEKYEHPEGTTGDDGIFSGLGGVFSMFSIKSIIKMFISEILGIFYAAAALCINTIRTFYLLVLAIVGPVVFGLSVFDGFEQTLSRWFARYIHVFMWLPVCNIFSAICSKVVENMFTLDNSFFDSAAYLVFLVIAIIGYTTVPNVAGYIVQAGGNDTLLHKVNNLTRQAGKAAVGAMV